MQDIFTEQNLMLALVGGTVATAIADAFNIKMAQKQPLITLASGAVILPVANQFLGKKKVAA